MDNFEDKQSKYGKIYKVAGPRKYSQFDGRRTSLAPVS